MLTTNKIHGVDFVEWGDPDRFFAGLRILKSNKAEKSSLLEPLPWSNSPPEGEILKRKAIELGIPENKIILTKIAANTFEEAEAIKELLTVDNINKVIIVTSSFHIQGQSPYSPNKELAPIHSLLILKPSVMNLIGHSFSKCTRIL